MFCGGNLELNGINPLYHKICRGGVSRVVRINLNSGERRKAVDPIKATFEIIVVCCKNPLLFQSAENLYVGNSRVKKNMLAIEF